jgi:hypothetical protein
MIHTAICGKFGIFRYITVGFRTADLMKLRQLWWPIQLIICKLTPCPWARSVCSSVQGDQIWREWENVHFGQIFKNYRSLPWRLRSAQDQDSCSPRAMLRPPASDCSQPGNFFHKNAVGNRLSDGDDIIRRYLHDVKCLQRLPTTLARFCLTTYRLSGGDVTSKQCHQRNFFL